MGIKECQLNIRLTSATDAWLEQVAGGRDRKAEYVRRLIEEDMWRQREEAEREMFNRAAKELTRVDLEERDDLLAAFSNRGAKE